MKIRAMAALAACLSSAYPATAGETIEYPAPTTASALRRSTATGQVVNIPPYRHVFTVRVYTTPQVPPYYNIPPEAVITPR